MGQEEGLSMLPYFHFCVVGVKEESGKPRNGNTQQSADSAGHERSDDGKQHGMSCIPGRSNQFQNSNEKSYYGCSQRKGFPGQFGICIAAFDDREHNLGACPFFRFSYPIIKITSFLITEGSWHGYHLAEGNCMVFRDGCL